MQIVTTFPDDVVYEAAHLIYSGEFADEAEERGASFSGCEITGLVPRLTAAEHDEIIRPLLARIEEQIGAPLVEIFRAGGIAESDYEDALGDLLMGVRGTGVSILDDYSDEWEKGCAALGVKDDYPYHEMSEYRDVAYNKLTAAGYPPFDGQTDELAKGYTPIIEYAFHWHGGQETALYAFASTRRVQSEAHRANTLAEIHGAILWTQDNGEQEPGDLANLDRLLAAVKGAEINREFFFH